jgi:hypothetical protein
MRGMGGQGGAGGGRGGQGGSLLSWCDHTVVIREMGLSVMLADVWITRRYYVSKDYSEFLGPKLKHVLAEQKVFWQNTFCFAKTLSFLAKHFLFLSVGPVHLYPRETISRLPV